MELPTVLIEKVVMRGQILHSDIFEGIDHAKFFVVIGVSEDAIAGFFYINSEINRHINTKPEQLQINIRCMLKITTSWHATHISVLPMLWNSPKRTSCEV